MCERVQRPCMEMGFTDGLEDFLSNNLDDYQENFERIWYFEHLCSEQGRNLHDSVVNLTHDLGHL